MTTDSRAMEPLISEPGTDTLIPGRQTSGAVLRHVVEGTSDKRPLGGAVWKRIRPWRRRDNGELGNVRRLNLASTTIRVGESSTSLDIWYVDLDVSADLVDRFRHRLSDDELAMAGRFHSDLDRARYAVGRATLRGVLADRLGCIPSSIRFSYGAT